MAVGCLCSGSRLTASGRVWPQVWEDEAYYHTCKDFTLLSETLTKPELAQLERDFLNALDYNVGVKAAVYTDWCARLLLMPFGSRADPELIPTDPVLIPTDPVLIPSGCLPSVLHASRVCCMPPECVACLPSVLHAGTSSSARSPRRTTRGCGHSARTRQSCSRSAAPSSAGERDCLGWLGMARDCLGLLGIAWDCVGLLGMAWDGLGLLGTAWYCLGLPLTLSGSEWPRPRSTGRKLLSEHNPNSDPTLSDVQASPRSRVVIS